jgi:hypothetical protein
VALSPTEFEQAGKARDLADLSSHPGWAVLLSALADKEKQLLEELALLDEPKAIVRAKDHWSIFRHIVQFITSAPENAKINVFDIKEAEGIDDSTLTVGAFLNKVPYGSDQLPLV